MFREPDLLNWQKASATNSKWVGFLTQGEIDGFYEREGEAISIEDIDNGKAIASTAASMDMDSSNNRIEGGGKVDAGDIASQQSDETGTNDAATVTAQLLGMAVIKNALVVDSPAYLKVCDQSLFCSALCSLTRRLQRSAT